MSEFIDVQQNELIEVNGEILKEKNFEELFNRVSILKTRYLERREQFMQIYPELITYLERVIINLKNDEYLNTKDNSVRINKIKYYIEILENMLKISNIILEFLHDSNNYQIGLSFRLNLQSYQDFVNNVQWLNDNIYIINKLFYIDFKQILELENNPERQDLINGIFDDINNLIYYSKIYIDLYEISKVNYQYESGMNSFNTPVNSFRTIPFSQRNTTPVLTTTNITPLSYQSVDLPSSMLLPIRYTEVPASVVNRLTYGVPLSRRPAISTEEYLKRTTTPRTTTTTTTTTSPRTSSIPILRSMQSQLSDNMQSTSMNISTYRSSRGSQR